jgi:hypothetical protein
VPGADQGSAPFGYYSAEDLDVGHVRFEQIPVARDEHAAGRTRERDEVVVIRIARDRPAPVDVIITVAPASTCASSSLTSLASRYRSNLGRRSTPDSSSSSYGLTIGSKPPSSPGTSERER